MSGQLLVDAVHSGYGRLPVLRDIDVEVGRGEVIALVGRNGAGKSTLLRTIAGTIRPTTGRVLLENTDITSWSPERRVRFGLSHVAEGRRIFGEQSVRANLELGMRFQRLDRTERAERIEEAVALFPALTEKFDARANTLSGGQQQMLAIAAALVRRPSVLMLDEPSLGLAPLLVEQVFAAVRTLRDRARTIVLVEQMVERALEFADRVYVLQAGAVVAVGTPRELQESGEIQRAYLSPATSGPSV